MTGSSGFVGKELVAIITASDGTVLRLDRNPDRGWVDNMSRICEEVGPVNPKVLVHAAVPTERHSESPWIRYHEQTLELYEFAARAGIPTVLLSSLSAHSGNHSVYSLQKQISESVARSFGISIWSLGIVESSNPLSPYIRFKRFEPFLRYALDCPVAAPIWLTTRADVASIVERLRDQFPSYQDEDFASARVFQAGLRGKFEKRLSCHRPLCPHPLARIQLRLLQRANRAWPNASLDSALGLLSGMRNIRPPGER
jgi:hypothetical protein